MTNSTSSESDNQGDARLASEDARESCEVAALADFGTNAIIAELEERGDLCLAVMAYKRHYGALDTDKAALPDPPDWAAPIENALKRCPRQDRFDVAALEAARAALAEGVSALARAEERERELLSALKEEQAWDMGGVPENEWMRRAEAAEEQVARVARNVQTLNRKLIQANEAKELAEEQVAALRGALPTDAELARLREHVTALCEGKTDSRNWRHYGTHIMSIALRLEDRKRAALSPGGEADA